MLTYKYILLLLELLLSTDIQLLLQSLILPSFFVSPRDI